LHQFLRRSNTHKPKDKIDDFIWQTLSPKTSKPLLHTKLAFQEASPNTRPPQHPQPSSFKKKAESGDKRPPIITMIPTETDRTERHPHIINMIPSETGSSDRLRPQTFMAKNISINQDLRIIHKKKVTLPEIMNSTKAKGQNDFMLGLRDAIHTSSRAKLL